MRETKQEFSDGTLVALQMDPSEDSIEAAKERAEEIREAGGIPFFGTAQLLSVAPNDMILLDADWDVASMREVQEVAAAINEELGAFVMLNDGIDNIQVMKKEDIRQLLDKLQQELDEKEALAREDVFRLIKEVRKEMEGEESMMAGEMYNLIESLETVLEAEDETV